MRHLFYVMLIILCLCTLFVGCNENAKFEEFLNQLAVFNQSIVGELKYDDPSFDLTALDVNEYSDLFIYAEKTDDYDKLIKMITKYVTEDRVRLTKDTFYICLKSNAFGHIILDDANTAYVDKILKTENVVSVEDAFVNFIEMKEISQ